MGAVYMGMIALDIECDTCNGNGYVTSIECGKSAAYCCGGCEVEEPCEECEGTGTKTLYIEEEAVKEIIFALSINNPAAAQRVYDEQIKQ